ncbi:MAG: tandem-95 repeat protein [Pseudomonadales bacterium]|nr:tandem-95 repeat protein [Pseudomonadales bacterium]
MTLLATTIRLPARWLCTALIGLLGSAAMPAWAVVANDDAYTTPFATTLVVGAPGVLGNDNPELDLTITAVLEDPPANGTVLLNPNGSFTYVPNVGFFGTDEFDYLAVGGLGLDDDSATVSITVEPPPNTPPVANPDAVVVPEDGSVSITLTGSDGEGDPLSFNVTGGPSNGSLSGAAPNLTYTPNANFNGSDSFTFVVNDGTVDSAPATVSITVTPENDAPVANGQAVSVAEDGSVSITLTGSDIDGDALSFSVSGGPSNGGLSGSAPNLTYTPNPDFNGADSFTFVVNDGTVDSAPATISITVTPENDPPVANDQAVSVGEDGSVAITLTGSDIDGDPLSYTVTGGPSNGSLSGAAPDLTYTPNPDFNGSDSFTFVVNDGSVDSGPATVSITVTEANDAPVVVGSIADVSVDEDGGSVAITLSGIFDDVDILTNGDSLTYTASHTGGGLFASFSVTGATLEMVPAPDQNGSATVTVRATDAGGLSAELSFQVTVNAVNDAPIVQNPIADVATFEDGPNVVIDLAPVFFDVDIATNGDVLAYAVTSNSNPTLFSSVTLSGTTLTFDLAPDQNGVAVIQVTATDLAGASVVDEFEIDVDPQNDVPVLVDDDVTIAEDSGPVVIAVLANDYLGDLPATITAAGVGGFSEGTPTTVRDQNGDLVTLPNGTVAIVGDTIEYVPKPDFAGTDFFTYTVTDANGDSASATVTITVTPVNDPPVGVPERTFTILENGSLTVNAASGLLVGAYDADGAVVDADGNPIFTPTLSAQLATGPLVGLFTFDSAAGTFTYTPPVDYTGVVTFSYYLSDGESLSTEPYLVRVVIQPAPDPTPPPPAGEVAVTYNLSQVPLEQSTSVPANVIVIMDDSGSMDWHITVRMDNDQGGFVLNNSGGATSGRASQSYYYLWNLPTNIFAGNTANGRILPTEGGLLANASTANNQYGVWRARNHLFNSMYYNPGVRYEPWVGFDSANQPFGPAVATAIRLDPRDPTNTFNILNNHTYTANGVPLWRNNGGTANINSTVYIPHYYSTTATAPLAWNSPNTLVEIRPANAPFAGGPNRTDCAVGDNNPLTCTYDQELQNFANWFQYYRSREHVAKNGIGRVVADVQDVRVGYQTINNSGQEPVRDMNDLYTEGNKRTLLDRIYSINSTGGTPLRRALERAGEIYSGNIAPDPILPAPEGLCQQNFALLFSDGYWNGPDPAAAIGNADANTASPFDGGRYADGFSRTLADVAMYYYKRDLRTGAGWDNLVPVSQRDVLGAPPGTFSGASPRMHQHMKTYTVAFGVTGAVDPAAIPTNPATAFAWPSPTATSTGKIDDMLHAAINGRGQYLNATNPQELQAALEAAFLEFTQAASSTSSAAFNSTSLREGTLLYRGFYDLRDSTGELTATPVDVNGVLAPTPLWRASEQLNPVNKSPDSRVIVTFDPTEREGIAFRHGSLTPEQQVTLTESQLNFIRGVRTDEAPAGTLRRRASSNALLGDIVNSSPVFVGAPRALNRDQAPYPVDDLYSAFAGARAGRTPVVYVGANDGILHGFNALTGQELFGYVPNKILDSTQAYRNTLNEFTNSFYQHKFFVDLTPRLNDVYIRANSGAASKSWNTVLMGGLGAGGKGFFALNVTDPATRFSSEGTAAGAVLWEFTDEDDTYPVDSNGDPLGGSVGAITDPLGLPIKDLGYSLSLPTLAMSNVLDAGVPARREWVAIFGNGPNSTSGIAKLFVLFMDRGIDGWSDGSFVKLDTGFGVPVAPAQQAGFPNGLGSPTAVDIDLNGTVDWVYAGDRLGNLYRFDLRDSDPDEWTVTRLFTATYTSGGVTRLQPILSQPLVVKHPTEQGFLVIFGTGSYVAKEDADNEEIQSIYAIWDRGASNPVTALADTKELRLVEQVMTNVVDDTGPTPVVRRILTSNPVEYQLEGSEPGTYGWYIDLDLPRPTTTISGAVNTDTSGRNPPGPQFPGEKAIRTFLFRDGEVITTTVLPSLDEFSCYGTRPGAILLFSALTGGDPGRPVIDFNTDGEIDDGDLVPVGGALYAGGLLFNQTDLDGALVDLSTLGGQGDTDFLFVSGGSDTISFRIRDVDDDRTGRLSWRELTLDN